MIACNSSAEAFIFCCSASFNGMFTGRTIPCAPTDVYKRQDLSSFDKITKSLFATMGLFNREAQILAQKMGFTYDMEVAEKMTSYAKEKLSNH